MARVGRFANYLRGILPCTDYLVTEMTAKAIGCLALAEGAYTAEYVEFEVRRALEWLSTDKNENKRLAAVSVDTTTFSSAFKIIHICIGTGTEGTGCTCPHSLLCSDTSIF